MSKKDKKDKKRKRQIGKFVAERIRYSDNGEVQTSEHTLDPDKDLIINDLNIQRDLQTHAARLGLYMKLREEAEYAMKLAKHDLLNLQEELCDDIRVEEENLDLPTSKRLGETSLKRRVNRGAAVKDSIQEYMFKATQYRTLDGFVTAMTERGRMLQSINKRQSDELNQTNK